ncbi:hypothetical protein I4P15_14795 [Enterobacter roggenkampii]|nr:hypothetical protein [Enterobacter roggenkampii]
MRRRPKQVVKNVSFGKALVPTLNKASILFINQDSIPAALNKLLNINDSTKLEKELEYLIKTKKVRAALNAYSDSFEMLGVRSIYTKMPFKNLLVFYKKIYESESEKLKKYVELRDQVEIALSKGDYEKLEQLLTVVKDSLGESIWYARIKLLLLYLNGDSNKMQDFCTQLKGRVTDSTIQFIVHYLMILTQSIDPRNIIEVVINKQLKELKSAGLVDYANLTQEFLVPVHMKDVKLTSYMLELFQKFNVIDQYNLITSSLITFLVNVKDEIAEEELVLFQGLFTSLYEITGDYKINNFLSSSVFSTCIDKKFEEENEEKKPKNDIKDTLISKGVYSKPIKNLMEIYDLNKRSTQSFDELRAHITRLNGTEASLRLENELIKAVPYYLSSDKGRNIEILFSILTQEAIPSDIETFYKLLAPADEIKEIDNLKSIDFININQDIIKDKISGTGVIKKIIEKNMSDFIQHNELDDAISLAANVLVYKEETYLCLPLKDLINKIDTEFKPTLDYLIVSHFYKKYESTNKSTLHNELFEEFILDNQVSKPSELIRNEELLTNKLEFFFKEICSLETMDFLSEFQNSDELRAERLRLLEHLHSTGTINKDEFHKEADEIVNQFVLDSSASHFQISKIYVDEIALKKKLSKEISTLFESYKYAEDSPDEMGVVTLEGDENSPIQAFVRGAKSDILLKSIGLMLESFLYDENHGLDTNLSTEIRHGFFSNYLRSDLESRRLISEIDADGNFKSITYWDDMYSSILSPAFLNQITDEFKIFTNDFNEAIREAQGWMKVSTSLEEKNALFIYNVYVNQYDYFKLWMEFCDTPEQFMDEVFGMFWQITDEILVLMREKINVDLKSKVQQLFYDLLRRLDLIKGGAVLTDLMSNIVASQNKTAEIISEISDWFNINQQRDLTQQTLNQVINVSINCLEKIKGKRINIIKSFENEVGSFIVDGFSVKKFILALINILENSMKHSGLNQELEIEIMAYTLNSSLCIDVKNNLSEEVYFGLTDDKINSLNNLLSSPDSIELMRAEGGTGLAKASNYLKQAYRGYNLSVSCENHKFITRLLKDEINING